MVILEVGRSLNDDKEANLNLEGVFFREHINPPSRFYSRVRIALAKNAGFSQNGSHMLLSLLASFGKTSMKQDKSKSTVACVIHFASTQHFYPKLF